jgi:hypothetical protein
VRHTYSGKLAITTAVGIAMMAMAALGGNMQQAPSNNAAEKTGARTLCRE